MTEDRWWKDFDAVVARAMAPGSRVLDIGCGDGGLVDRLTGLGFDALGVDPSAHADRRLIPKRLEDATELGTFDAVTAVMALHHADLEAVVQAVKGLLSSHGRLFVNELDWDAYDERAASWLAEHDSTNNNSVVGWRHEHSELHTGATIREALSASFNLVVAVHRPYLARMIARHDLEAEEHALIDAKQIPALGIWMIAERT